MVPIGERMEPDAVLAQTLLSLVEVETVRAILENAEALGDLGTGGADTDVEAQLAHAIGDEIFDQQNPLVRFENAFDLPGAAVTLGLFADVDHRLLELLRHESGVRYAGGLSAGDDVDRIESDLRLGFFRHLGDDLLAHLGKREQ